MYITDEILDDYKKWGEGDTVFLSASTGTGKTTFILHTLLKYAIEQNRRILYLVNRRVLKEQLEKELEGTVTNEMFSHFGYSFKGVGNYIEICTYQSLEEALKTPGAYKIIKSIKDFSYVVYDECHYFYTDSNYNTSTELSYDCLRATFDDKIQIFISATMKEVKELIINRPPTVFKNDDALQNVPVAAHMPSWFDKKGINVTYEYAVDENYNYVDLTIFNDLDELKNMIIENVTKTKEKWLVFIDSIDRGKELRNQLIGQKSIEDKITVFIDAKYSQDYDAADSVSQITRQNYTDKRIIISTAVMDNGISIKDLELRNIVILADTKESFIQMLGRKRKDAGDNQKKVSLYICKRDEKYFISRQAEISKALRYYDKHRTEFEKIWKVYMTDGREFIIHPYDILRYRLNTIATFQQNILDDIIHYKSAYEFIRKFCYFMGGCIAANSFAIARYRNLSLFYSQIIEDIKEDPNAFIKEQAKWLGIDEEKVCEKIDIFDELENNECKSHIEKGLCEVLGKKLNKEDNLKLRKKIRTYLLHFVPKDENYEDNKKSVTRTDAPISVETFNNCMQWVDLPYRMEKENAKIYIIKKIDNASEV